MRMIVHFSDSLNNSRSNNKMLSTNKKKIKVESAMHVC